MRRLEQLLYRMHDHATTLARRPSKPPYSPADWKTLAGLLELYFHRAAQHRAAVDNLARRLAQTGTLPEVHGWDSYLLSLRLYNAWDFLAQMLVEDSQGREPIPDPNSAYTDAALIEWLLIPIWDRRGDHWLKMTAMTVALNRPLYGLDPAPE